MNDTWTKLKGVRIEMGGGDGWSQGVWWGEHGDDFTGTTINKKIIIKM